MMTLPKLSRHRLIPPRLSLITTSHANLKDIMRLAELVMSGILVEVHRCEDIASGGRERVHDVARVGVGLGGGRGVDS